MNKMTWAERQRLTCDVISRECEAAPEEVGYDGERLHVLDRHMQSMLERGMIRSGSYCLMRRGKVFADAAMGALAAPWRGRERFYPDTFFEIQSVTKVMTAAAVLKLAEDGVLYLDEPVADWIGEFAAGEFQKITIFHLLTHTSGLVAINGARPGEREAWFRLVDGEHVAKTWIPAILSQGLYDKPGRGWQYSMAGYLILGEIISRAAGMRAEEFIRKTILLPCGMREAHWKREVTEEWLGRYNIANEQDVAAVRRYGKEGRAAFIHYAPWQAQAEWKELPETAGGLMSTARELAGFGQMLLGGGQYRGERVLGRKAVEYLFHNLLEGDVRDFCWDHPGNPVVYGAGAPILTGRTDRQQLVSEGVVFHEGHGACMLMIDRKEQFVAVYRTQFANGDDWFAEGARATASILWSGL